MELRKWRTFYAGVLLKLLHEDDDDDVALDWNLIESD